jgi:hypothetical protein
MSRITKAILRREKNNAETITISGFKTRYFKTSTNGTD